MNNQFFKRIPFELELAKKIINKEVKGEIVTRDGRKVRIICIDREDKRSPISPSNVIALVKIKDGHEVVCEFMRNGMYYITKDSDLDLHIKVPTYFRNYSNFVPQKWQPCLVRDDDNGPWNVLACAGKNTDGDVIFYGPGRHKYIWRQVLPLSKVTERLVGTTKSYEQLIKELDENEQD